MRTYRIVLMLIFLGVILLVQHYAPVSSVPISGSQASSGEVDTTGIPKKAYQVLETVRQTGHAPEGYVGGRHFQNREHRLPADGDYREYDVDPHEGNRNAERIIVEWETKKAWYTGDHYQTFIPMQ